MNKTVLLAATAVLALTAGSAMAAAHPGLVGAKPTNVHVPPHSAAVLYSQNSNFGYGIVSQNFTSGSFGTVYNAAGADDFVVPAGAKWKVKTVDVTGVYFNGSGPANSEVITFYKNKKGHPGKIAGAGLDSYVVNCADNFGSFSCAIPATKLAGGTTGKTYWVSVVVNMPFVTGQGEWGWAENTVTHNQPGQWRNPGGGFGTGCNNWGNTSVCIGLGADDFAFDLQN